jgi:hypothetical protein
MHNEPHSEWRQWFAGGGGPMVRRRFLRHAAGAAGAAVLAGLWQPVPALADEDDDDGGTPASYAQLLVNNPYQTVGESADASSIYNFKGLIAAGLVKGTGTGRGLSKSGTLVSQKMYFHTDTRIMIGEFVDKNGVKRHGSFVSF